MGGFILFPLLFGIIQYGLFFNDSLSARQGVREAARQGVVQMPVADTCGTAGVTWSKLRCYTKAQVAPVAGTAYVKVLAPDTGGWKKGNRLLVCAAVKVDALGLLPMPNNSVVRAKAQLSIEQDSAPPTDTNTADTDPSGANWSWCA